MIVFFHQLLESLKNSPARRNKLVLVLNFVALFLNLALWVFLFFQLKKILASQPEVTAIPLHYNVFLGIDLIGQWYHAFILPLIGLVVVIVNFILAFALYSKKILISYFLSFTSLLTQLILIVASLLIILINL
jgi:hypothetical protein